MNEYVPTKTGELEHRVIYKKTKGPIPDGWVIHHIDGVKNNNIIENLIALPEMFHNKLHSHQTAINKILSKEEIKDMLIVYLTGCSRYAKHLNNKKQKKKHRFAGFKKRRAFQAEMKEKYAANEAKKWVEEKRKTSPTFVLRKKETLVGLKQHAKLDEECRLRIQREP